ncbi:secreted protein [Melampsora americana]|nr:secreted protein [Melampsora americana]
MSFKTNKISFIFLLVIGLINFSIGAQHQCELGFSFGAGKIKGSCEDINQKTHNCVRSSCSHDNTRFVPLEGCTLYGTKAPKTNPTTQRCEQYQYPSLYNNQQILCTNGGGVSFLCPGVPGKVPFLTCSSCDD